MAGCPGAAGGSWVPGSEQGAVLEAAVRRGAGGRQVRELSSNGMSLPAA